MMEEKLSPTDQDLVKTAIQRLISIQWTELLDDSHDGSFSALVREHMRRQTLWYKELVRDRKEVSFTSFDAATVLAVEPPVVEIEMQRFWYPHLEQLEHRKQPGPSHNDKRYCRGSVHWAAIKHQWEKYDVGLLSPYDPLLELYSRGGDFSFHHGWIKVGTITMKIYSLDQYLQLEPLTDFSPERLNRLDEELNKRRKNMN